MVHKRKSMILIAGGMALCLSACGASGDGQSAEEGGTLTFANWQWLEPERGEVIWQAVQQYEEENPNATVQSQEITRRQYENTLQTQMGAGDGPDVFVIPITFFPMLAEANLLESLDGVLDDDQLESLNSTNDHGQVDGERLALTWEVVNYAFFWNQQLLDDAGVAPPSAPHEIATVSQQIRDETGASGLGVRHLMNEETAWWTDFAAWPYGFDGGWSDGEELTINSSENIAALEAYKDVYDSGAIPIGSDASTMRSSFAEGELAMMIDSSAALPQLVEGGGILSHEDIGVSPLPFPGDGTVRDQTLIGINANSENKELAQDFIRWLFTEEAQQDIQAGMGASSVGTDVEPSSDYVEERPWVPTFVEQTEVSRPSIIEGFETHTAEIRTIVLNQISMVLTEDISVEQALADAQAAAEDVVS